MPPITNKQEDFLFYKSPVYLVFEVGQEIFPTVKSQKLSTTTKSTPFFTNTEQKIMRLLA